MVKKNKNQGHDIFVEVTLKQMQTLFECDQVKKVIESYVIGKSQDMSMEYGRTKYLVQQKVIGKV